MPSIPIHNLGAGGIIRDIPSHLLPPEVWSDGRNVRFVDGKVKKFTGSSKIYDPPSVAPYWTLSVRGAAERSWLYAGLTKVFAFASVTHTDITRVSGDYSATEDGLWNGGVLGGIPVINNGVDVPQFWSPSTVATKLQDLTNWPAGTIAKNIKPFLVYLVALNITRAGNNLRHMYKWSHAADPGSLPSSWDESDPTVDAGEAELSDSESGELLDQLHLGSINILYKENATWGMQFIGGQFIFRTFQILETSGLLTDHAAAIIGTGRGHFLASGDDVIVHSGRPDSARSVLDKRMRKWLNSTMSTTHFGRSFSVRNFPAKEMMFCFPEEGELWPNLGLTWNWVDDTIAVRELQTASFIGVGSVLAEATEDWDSDTETWDSDFTPWDELRHRPQEQRLVQVDPINSKFLYLDDTEQFDGVNMTAYIERTGLAIVGQDRQGNPKVDIEVNKLCPRIWPKMRGGPVNIRVGKQEEIDGAITWSGPKAFDPATEKFLDVDPPVSGPLLAVRFESATNVSWELDGYDMEIELLGKF
jgi:hypothetical protein